MTFLLPVTCCATPTSPYPHPSLISGIPPFFSFLLFSGALQLEVRCDHAKKDVAPIVFGLSPEAFGSDSTVKAHHMTLNLKYEKAIRFERLLRRVEGKSTSSLGGPITCHVMGLAAPLPLSAGLRLFLFPRQNSCSSSPATPSSFLTFLRCSSPLSHRLNQYTWAVLDPSRYEPVFDWLRMHCGYAGLLLYLLSSKNAQVSPSVRRRNGWMEHPTMYFFN